MSGELDQMIFKGLFPTQLFHNSMICFSVQAEALI